MFVDNFRSVFFSGSEFFRCEYIFFFFFFNDTATTEIYTLSLHDALPISSTRRGCCSASGWRRPSFTIRKRSEEHTSELSHSQISYAVFCLKKKKKNKRTHPAILFSL